MKERQIELLAPAGSYEGFEAAIGAGADAVYVGGAAFGARAYAKNFGEEELLRAINTAHIHGKKLYLTVNTLLKNREMEEELFAYLSPFYREGLDAVIVQDLGVFSFIKKCFPELPLHASTQMTVTGPEGDYDDYSWTYWGYDTIEAMYNDCVRAKLDQYTTEESVEDVDTSSEPTKLKTLPSDAKEYNGHYYERVDISLTWEEAKSRCERKGGHLVTITDADENNWIVKNINPADDNYCWLGGEKNESGAWGWVTGEAWDYTSFAEGQPDFMNSAEYYLCTSSPANTWNDSDMEGNNWDPGWGYSRGISGYIIEWDSDPAA